MDPKKGGCKGCAYSGKTVVPPSGDIKKAKLVIVGQSPGEVEVEQGKPFVGPSGRMLWRELERVGIKREDCYVTNLVKCKPPSLPTGGDEPPPVTVRRHCQKQFEEEWAAIKGKVVLLLGSNVVRHFTGKALSRVRGRPSRDEKGNTYFPTWHPAYIVRSSSVVHLWRNDLRALVNLLDRPVGHKRVKYSLVATPTEVAELCEQLKNVDFAFDFETTTLEPEAAEARILCVAFSDGQNTWVVDWDALGSSIDEDMKNLFESDAGKIVQNATFEATWLKMKKNINLRNVVFDPAMAQYLLDEGIGVSVSLKHLVWRYFPEYGGYEEEIDINEIATEKKDKLFEYNAADAYLTFKLREALDPQLKEKGMAYLYYDVMLPAVYPVTEMQASGIQLDVDALMRKKEEIEKRMAEVEQEILNHPDAKKVEGFSITSTPSHRKLFYDVMKFKPKRYTPNGAPQLTKNELAEFADAGVEIAQKILEYRSLRKTLKTYIENFLKRMTPEGRLHTSYNMVVAKAGRITSGNPNLNNVPKPLRELFVSRFSDGYLCHMDFKQIEMRVMAFESQDPGLIRVFRSGRDPHAEVAAEILGIPLEEVTSEQRQMSKAINFGLFYGLTVPSLADRLGISVEEAQSFVDRYFERYKGVKIWQKKQIKKAERGEIIVNMFGRRRNISQFHGTDREHRAFNFPIQCLPLETRVLTEDLRWVPVGDISVGDTLIGFDEFGGTLDMKFREWRRATVTQAEVKRLPVYEICLDNGDRIEATGDHRWLAYLGFKPRNRFRWLRTDRMKPGHVLPHFFDVWTEDCSREAGYLAGVFDADGCLAQHDASHRHTNTIQFTQQKNVVWDTVCRLLAEKGFDFGFNECDMTEERGYRWMQGRIRGGTLATMRFLGKIRPKRLLEKFDISIVGRFVNYGQRLARVKSVRLIGVKEVMAIETSTRTFFAEGYGSHNSGAADIHMYTMGVIWEVMRKCELKSVLVASVIDALMADCPTLEEAQKVEKIMKSVVASLPRTFKFMKAPMAIDTKIAKNWKEASE